MSDRIAVINHGRLAQVGTPHAIYNQPANAFVADFIGESTMLPLSRDAENRLCFENHVIAADSNHSGDCALVIRPERLFMADAGEDDEHRIVFSGVVREFVFQGETAFALMVINDQHELAFRFGTDASSSQNVLRPGDPVSLGLSRSDVIIIPQDDAA